MPLIDFSTAGTVKSGDVNAGGPGLDTSSVTNQTVLSAYGEDAIGTPGTVIAPQAVGTVAGHPVPWWLALIVLLVVVKFIAEKNDEAGEFKNIRVGAFNIAIITLCAVIGLTLAKWVFGIYKIPGLSAVVEAA